MQSRSATNKVWIGNIPYEATEATLKELMSVAGHVTSIRIRYDRDSGQSKGFAFCEYQDPDSCAIAVKHLNGTVLSGRVLKIDYSLNERLKSGLTDDWTSKQDYSTATAATSSGTYYTLKKDRVQPGYQPKSSETTNLRIDTCRIVAELTVPQLFFILAQLQSLILRAPDTAKRLLRDNPTLCYAIVHALFICGMITERPDELTASDDILLEHIYENTEQLKKKTKQALEIHKAHSKSLDDLLQRTRAKVNTSSTQLSDNEPEQQSPNLDKTDCFSATTSKEQEKTLNSTENNTLKPTDPRYNSSQPQYVSYPDNFSTNNLFVPPTLYSPLIDMHASQGSETMTINSPMSGTDQNIDITSEASVPDSTMIEQSVSSTDSQTQLSPQVIEQLLNRSDILQQMLSITESEEALLTDMERAEINMIRQALRERGMNI